MPPVDQILSQPVVRVYKSSATSKFFGPLPQGERRGFVTENFKPIDSFDPDRRNVMQAKQGDLQPVQFKVLQRLTTVIAQAAAGNGSTVDEIFADLQVGGKVVPGPMTMRQFMALKSYEQVNVIDQAWNKVCHKRAYDTPLSRMFEPDKTVVAPEHEPVPSGAIPDGGGGMRCGYEGTDKKPNAFKELGVGFRTDGSDSNIDDTIVRILTNGGMTVQLRNRYLMYSIKGWEVEGTVVGRDTSGPRIWSTKDDLFNESAVCISRNFYGATAFPLREFKGQALLWAVDVAGLDGYDTEEFQNRKNRLWRPGEKAFNDVPGSRMIGYVRFEKLGAPDAGGWKFRIPAGAKWNFVGTWARESHTSRTKAVRDYVTKQLDAWGGGIERTISGAYDFA